jgi:hypothetical protein
LFLLLLIIELLYKMGSIVNITSQWYFT